MTQIRHRHRRRCRHRYHFLFLKTEIPYESLNSSKNSIHTIILHYTYCFHIIYIYIYVCRYLLTFTKAMT